MTEKNIDELIILKKGIEQSIDGIAVANMDGVVTLVNDSWAKMHEMEISEILNKHLGQFHNEYQFKNEVISFNEKVLTKGKHIGYVGHIKKDGTVFPTWMSVTAMLDDNSKPLGLLAVCRDISEIKAYEAEIIKQKEAAEMANILKNEFLLKVSHELRTPMNGIIGNISLLDFTKLDSEQQEYISSLSESSNRLMDLIDNLLQFSTIDIAHDKIEKIEFNIDELLEEIIESLSNVASKKGIKMIKNIYDNVPKKITNDQVRINQILFNLINNGIKFTKEGKVKIAVTIDNDSGQNKLLKFYIVDTGIGISPEYIDKIFNSFAQEDSTSTRKYEGMGIGLYVSRLLAERLGGSLTVESTVGKGSTFCLSIPFII